jgi:Ca2+-binding EF-hand superfamily protein
MEEAIETWFSAFDFNADGAIDSNELNQVFTNLDADQNGFISRAELLNA